MPLDTLPGRALIHDRELIRDLYAARVRAGHPCDEVWDGLLVLIPLPDNDHQHIRFQLAVAIENCHPHAVYPGVNVSDRDEGWLTNSRSWVV